MRRVALTCPSSRLFVGNLEIDGSRLAFPGGSGPGTCAPPAAPCSRPRPQTCHVTKIRLKPRRSPTNLIVHPPVFPPPPWCDLTPEQHGGPLHVWTMFSPHRGDGGRSGHRDADDGCQLTPSPAPLCPHSSLLFWRPRVLPRRETRSIFDVLLHNQETEDDTTLEFHQELLRWRCQRL